MRPIAAFITCLLATTLAIEQARADGAMFVTEATWRRHRERAMINEPEQKAVVFFSKGQEQLIISPSYEGKWSDFAWVVPVPARPKVEILKGAIFHELATLMMPKPRSAALPGKATMADGHVTVLERKTVGAYDVSVLAATDGKALVKWLAANKYHLPDKAIAPINAYVKDRWTFVACRIKAPAAAKGLATGTLAPLKLTFPAKKPVYPLKLSSVNPKPFMVLVYLLLPLRELGGDAGRVSFRGIGGYSVTLPVRGSVPAPPGSQPSRLNAGQSRYATLAKLSHEELRVFYYHFHATPETCNSDLDWTIRPGGLSHAKGDVVDWYVSARQAIGLAAGGVAVQ